MGNTLMRALEEFEYKDRRLAKGAVFFVADSSVDDLKGKAVPFRQKKRKKAAAPSKPTDPEKPQPKTNAAEGVK